MLDYSQTINYISNAIDTDEVDNILECLIISLTEQSVENESLLELHSHIKKEITQSDREKTIKMKRAMHLIECEINIPD